MTNYDELIGTLRHKGAYKKVWLGEETFELRCQDPTAIDAADAIEMLQADLAAARALLAEARVYMGCEYADESECAKRIDSALAGKDAT